MGKRPAFEMADVIRNFGPALAGAGQLHAFQKKTLTDLLQCRTHALGGHLDACDGCGHVRASYNSCRNRNCPKCQSVEREAWIIAREQELLPAKYFHVVFTIPDQLNGLALHNPRFIYNALFEAAWQTIDTFARDAKWLGAKTGATMVLHTWGQNLSLHPHVHCIVPAGGLAHDGHWRQTQADARQRFLFPVKAMSKVFRGIFLSRVLAPLKGGLLVVPPCLAQTIAEGQFPAWRNRLYRKSWVVYAKQPFGGPQQVIEYLGRYTHKSAISNHRIVSVSDTQVAFTYKDYRQGGDTKVMTLDGGVFLQRWVLHILPPGFRRMRHYGILANATKKVALHACRESLGAPHPVIRSRQEIRVVARHKLLKGQPEDRCPCCQQGTMVCVGHIPPTARAPPAGEFPLWVAVAG